MFPIKNTTHFISCNDKNYTINPESYPSNIEKDFINNIKEIISGNFVGPKPITYSGFKVDTNYGTLVVNSTESSCAENFHLISVYTRAFIEHCFTNSTNTFFPEEIKCMNICFAGNMNSTDFNLN